VLGESGTKVVLQNINSSQYSDNPEEFHRNLYEIFKEGSLVLEEVIVKKLFQRLNVHYEEKTNFDFSRYVNRAKQLYVTRQKRLAGDQHDEKKTP
jgi:hypothetical protein